MPQPGRRLLRASAPVTCPSWQSGIHEATVIVKKRRTPSTARSTPYPARAPLKRAGSSLLLASQRDLCNGLVDMKAKLGRAVCGLFLLGTLTSCGPQVSLPQGVRVYFSPNGGATEAVVNALEATTNSVLVQAYSFTSAPIAQALVQAHRRGVRVEVILDRSQRTEKYSEADFLQHNGIHTLIDAQHAIAHNKIIILDDYVVLTGSFNFTKAAEEHNAENLLVISDPALARQYAQNWHAHERHSEAYAGRSGP